MVLGRGGAATRRLISLIFTYFTRMLLTIFYPGVIILLRDNQG